MTDTASLTQRLQQLESAVVADVMVTMGLEGQVVAPDLRALDRHWKIAGPAICARGTDQPGPTGLSTFGLDEAIYPGGIVVIDTDGCEWGAILGDNMVTSMTDRGARGFVVDGGIRDGNDFLAMQTPVFCRYSTPINAHKYWRFTAFEKPVTLRGIWRDVTVNPGDLLIGDADGIAVLPRLHAERIIADAEIHQRTENGIKEALLAGGDRKAVTEAAGRLKHVAPLKG